MTHNNPATFPRVATVLGFIGPDQLYEATVAVIGLQRDHGDRSNRRRARLKYVVEDRGIKWVRHELAERYGLDVAPPVALPALRVPDHLGWHAQGDGRWWLGVPVDSGRIEGGLRLALREAVERFGVNPVFTPQQDVLLSDLAEADRAALEAVLHRHGVERAAVRSPLANWALACTALPFCGLALTEAERARGAIVADIEAVLARHGVANERIGLRIAGCPNGCSRPYGGEIGLVGRMPGHYALFVGGDFEGTRLSFKLVEKVKAEAIGATLEPLVARWAAERHPGEGFGDFCDRIGLGDLQAGLPQTLREAA